MANPSLAAVERRYSASRAHAFTAAEQRLAEAGIPTRLLSISSTALEQAAAWEASGLRVVHWDWTQAASDYRKRPNRFELAIWSSDGILCGLALGRCSPGAQYASIEYVEAAPGDHPLKGRVIPAALSALAIYAEVIEKTEIRLIEPTEALIPIYEQYGFALESPPGQRQYMSRRV